MTSAFSCPDLESDPYISYNHPLDTSSFMGDICIMPLVFKAPWHLCFQE